MPFQADLPSSDAMVTVAEAASIRGVTAQAIRNQIAAGALPTRRYGRVWLVNEYEVRQHAGKRGKQSGPAPGGRPRGEADPA